MKDKNIIKNFTISFAVVFSLSLFITFIIYSIYEQSILYFPLIIFGAIFSISFYFKHRNKISVKYFILAYLVFLILTAIISIFYLKTFYLILIVFAFTNFPFLFIIDDDNAENFFKKQRFSIKFAITSLVSIIYLFTAFLIAVLLIVLFLNSIFPQQTTFLPNINATIYYSSSTMLNYKPLNTPNILNFFYFFNPSNKTEIEGIAKVIKVDNVSYENSFRAYCLNAQTTKYWIQDCITYLPYYNTFSKSQNYELATEIWQGQKSLLNVDEIIPNASIYKNQTFYLKLVVENNTEIAYETNNGKSEYIKVELPKNQSFGVITDNSSMNTEIHEDSFYAINTGPLNYYALNTILISLSGNFTKIGYGGFYYYFGNSSSKEGNYTIFNITKLSNNSVMTTTYYYPMNALQLKDMQSIENGNCMIFSDYMLGIPFVAIENWSKSPNTILTNLTLCNSNETFGEYLKSINKSI